MRRRDEQFPDNGFEAWGGYMQAKIAKLEEQFDAKAENEKPISNVFKGVSIFVNGFTDPSADELKALMPKHGGVYHTYQRSDDFIIASNLPDTKVKNMSLARVVRPEWITESIAANRLLNYKDYLLYKNSSTQKQLSFSKIKLKDVSKLSLLQPNSKECNYDLKDNMSVEHSKISIDQSACVKNELDALNDTKKTTLAESNIKPNPAIQNNTKTAADSNFISEFYNNSRLHHISQLGACFKQHINDLREDSNFEFPARQQLKQVINSLTNNVSQIRFERGKTIMHIDMDCFFVSVGLRNKSELVGKPIAVTHSKGGQARPKRPGVDRNTEFNLYRQKQEKRIRKATGVAEEDIEFECRIDNITDEDDKYGSMSEIASCSYEARAKGIRNGMFMGAALRLCPDLKTIPYDFEGYKEVAYTLYNTIAQYTLDIEAVSCDEMYVDCTELLKDMNVSVQDFSSALRNEIKSKTGCPCSTGFGGNRLQARLATKRAKPDGQFFLSEDLVADFMYDIYLKDLPGVGRQISQKLESLGHSTCGSLQQMTLASLTCHLGVKTGHQLFDQCRGRDTSPLTFQTVRKSVSAEVNYGIRFENIDQCINFLKQLCSEVHSRMIQFKVMGKCITLKLMVRAEEAPVETAKFMGHGFCNVINKSITLINATNDIEIITKEVISICKKLNINPKEMRGVGIQMTKLESTASKPIIGAMNKFLCSKSAKNETKLSPTHVANDRSTSENQYHSPIKQTVASPKRKSPILQVKSPRKKRGRPPKVVIPQQSSSKNMLTKFLQGPNKASNAPYRDPMVKADAGNKAEGKREIKILIKNEKKVPEQPQPQGLTGLPWREVRELLGAWLDSDQTPLLCDVNLISSYMSEMVINKNLEKLKILLNFLQRRISEIGDDAWVEVFMHLEEQVQNAMIAVYGKRLHLGQ